MDKNTLLFSKTRDVKSPVRAHATDAGIDFFIPNDLIDTDIYNSYKTTGTVIHVKWSEDEKHIEKIIVPPHGSVLIPSGIKVIVPEGFALIFFNKSGVATKKHILRGACVCDQGYFGEILFNMNNVSNEDVELSTGEKLIQGVLIPVGSHQPVEVNDIMNYTIQSERGEGGFGSSGTK